MIIFLWLGHVKLSYIQKMNHFTFADHFSMQKLEGESSGNPLRYFKIFFIHSTHSWWYFVVLYCWSMLMLIPILTNLCVLQIVDLDYIVRMHLTSIFVFMKTITWRPILILNYKHASQIFTHNYFSLTDSLTYLLTC